jgi:hypothetical protein
LGKIIWRNSLVKCKPPSLHFPGELGIQLLPYVVYYMLLQTEEMIKVLNNLQSVPYGTHARVKNYHDLVISILASAGLTFPSFRLGQKYYSTSIGEFKT